MPGQQSTTLGYDAGDCDTCLTLLGMFCKRINIGGPSVVLAFLSLGMQPSRKQRKDQTQLVRLSTLLDESRIFVSHQAKKELRS